VRHNRSRTNAPDRSSPAAMETTYWTRLFGQRLWKQCLEGRGGPPSAVQPAQHRLHWPKSRTPALHPSPHRPPRFVVAPVGSQLVRWCSNHRPYTLVLMDTTVTNKPQAMRRPASPLPKATLAKRRRRTSASVGNIDTLPRAGLWVNSRSAATA